MHRCLDAEKWRLYFQWQAGVPLSISDWARPQLKKLLKKFVSLVSREAFWGAKQPEHRFGLTSNINWPIFIWSTSRVGYNLKKNKWSNISGNIIHYVVNPKKCANSIIMFINDRLPCINIESFFFSFSLPLPSHSIRWKDHKIWLVENVRG